MKAENNAVVACLADQIVEAELEVQKKQIALKQAQEAMEQANNSLYQLKHQRDVIYINSLQGKPDWKLAFNYSPDETAYIYDYRESVLASRDLKKTGHYHSETLQHIFYISFETDTSEEREKIKNQVEFILNHLKFNPKDNTKSIFIHNMRNDAEGQWELLFSGNDSTYALVKTNYGSGRYELKYESLDALLKKVQSLSDVAFESLDVQQA